jgi:hypothetical protein
MPNNSMNRPVSRGAIKRSNNSNKTLKKDLRFNIRILSADMVGYTSLPKQTPCFCQLIFKGKQISQTKPSRSVTKTPIWNQVLSFELPRGSRDINRGDYRTVELSVFQQEQQEQQESSNEEHVPLGTGSLQLCDIIYDTELAEFGGELVLHDNKGNAVGRLMFKADSDYSSTTDLDQESIYLPIMNRSNNTSSTRSIANTTNINTTISTGQYNSKNAMTDSQRYLHQLKQSMETRTQLELSRQEKLNAERLRLIALNKKRKKKRKGRKKKKILLPPGPASYNVDIQSNRGGGRFSTANPKSYIDWTMYRSKQTPGPNEYGFGESRPPTSGGRFNTSKPKSEIDWVIYHAKQVPGPFEYQPPLDQERKMPGGGKISEAKPKSQLDWVVYHSRDIPAPNAYPPLKPPKIGGGRFSTANPKSETDWVIYRSKQTPSPNEYGDGGRPKTSGGRFNSSKPKSQLDWVSYFAARTPSSADYCLPEGASSDYFTASVNQSRPPGFQGTLYGSGVGSIRFPTGDSRPREGKWVRVKGGQIWDDGNVESPLLEEVKVKTRRRQRKKKKTRNREKREEDQVFVM